MPSDQPIIPAGCVNHPECLKEYGQLHYIPSIGGNAFFLAFFIIAIITQMSALLGGCLLEVVGYVGRIMLWDDIFNNNSFIIYLVGLTIGPAFFSAAIYLSLSRILAIYGETLSFLKPRVITSIFIGCDLLSLILQAAGGAIASTADTQSSNDMGVNLMLAGLSTQVAATAIFAIVCAHLMWAIRKYPHKVKQETTQFRRGWRCRSFMWGEYFVFICPGQRSLLTLHSYWRGDFLHPHSMRLPLR
jgi:tellurite resistance protein TehA-like permease